MSCIKELIFLLVTVFYARPEELCQLLKEKTFLLLLLQLLN